MGGGAWPFLVGGVICLVNSVNERDLNLLTSGVMGVRAHNGVAAFFHDGPGCCSCSVPASTS